MPPSPQNVLAPRAAKVGNIDTWEPVNHPGAEGPCLFLLTCPWRLQEGRTELKRYQNKWVRVSEEASCLVGGQIVEKSQEKLAGASHCGECLALNCTPDHGSLCFH